jgi:hypothetical protein
VLLPAGLLLHQHSSVRRISLPGPHFCCELTRIALAFRLLCISKLQVELSCRVATLLLRLHHSQLTATPSARQTLVDLHQRLRAAVQGLRDTLGFNIAALKYMQRVAKENSGVDEGDVVKAARRQLLAG